MNEKMLSIKQKMNLEEKSIFELLDKVLFLQYSDEEKLKMLEYIKTCRLRYLELNKQFEMEKQNKNKQIANYYYKPRKRWD